MTTKNRSMPERCPKCGGPWIVRDHEYMAKIVLDERCLYCGESIYHKGKPKMPTRREAKAHGLRLCLGCQDPMDTTDPRQRYHDAACKWLGRKRREEKRRKNKHGV